MFAFLHIKATSEKGSTLKGNDFFWGEMSKNYDRVCSLESVSIPIEEKNNNKKKKKQQKKNNKTKTNKQTNKQKNKTKKKKKKKNKKKTSLLFGTKTGWIL